jgi:hypothetical protein
MKSFNYYREKENKENWFLSDIYNSISTNQTDWATKIESLNIEWLKCRF